MIKCTLCQDVGWVCEEHPGRPWAGAKACGCGAAGMPCSLCNAPDDGGAPRMPDGFEIDDDKNEGWLH
jgi:hypothetical protein